MNITVFIAQEYPAYFPGSTNPLDLYALWPGEMSATTPALRAIAVQTVATMGLLGSWQQGNAFPEIVPAAVRAGLEPLWILGNISARVNSTMAPSGVLAEGAETQGVTQGINDMLCASWDGVLRLLRWFYHCVRLSVFSSVHCHLQGYLVPRSQAYRPDDSILARRPEKIIRY